MADMTAFEDLLLPKLSLRLEQALDHVAAADAMAHLGEIARLCAEAETLARAAMTLIEP